MSDPVTHKSNNDLVRENQELRRALDAAVRALTPFEEPGRHFGSPLFLSLVCVLSDQADKACWDVINEYLEAEKQREEAGIPVEHIRINEIKVKIGKADSFMLPDDVVENRAVHLVIATLRDTQESHLRMMTPRQLKSMVDENLHDAELDSAIKILERNDVDILKQVWIYTDPISEEEYCLSDEDRKEVLESGTFVHPDKGVIVEDFRTDLSIYYALNSDNQEFMAWKTEFDPATMRI